MEIFLKEKEIKWESIELKEETDLIVECEACDCGTGFRFYLNIDIKFSEKVVEIGFKQSK